MMSPQIALHDPIFRSYLCIVPASLALGGLILIFLQWGLKKKLGSIWATYRSWLVMAAIGLLVIFVGRVATIAGLSLLSIFAFAEFARGFGLNRDWWMISPVYLGIIGVGIAAIIGRYDLFLVLPGLIIVCILLIPVLRNRAGGQFQSISLAIVGFIYVGWLFGHLGFFANAPNAYGFLCYIIFATELSDVAAFTCGRLFGRHPLRSEISPKKTWEGAFGALIVSMILPWVLRFSFPFFNTTQIILTGLIVGVGGQLGDLSVSMIKREIGTKDMGAAIPGHGGVLDRIDSLIFVAPLFMRLASHYHAL
jgi:phosphatidate cytidylyltransferase